MKTLIEIFALFVTFLFGFLVAHSDSIIVQAYGFIAFIGLGALTLVLIWENAKD